MATGSRWSWAASLTGLVVALIEETFLRGAMQTAITRESGARVAIVLTSLVYAATHFFGRYRVAAADVNAGSGLDMLAAHARRCSRSRCDILDAFLCLSAVGVLLGMVRVRTGNIAALHRPARRLGGGDLRGARDVGARSRRSPAPGC